MLAGLTPLSFPKICSNADQWVHALHGRRTSILRFGEFRLLCPTCQAPPSLSGGSGGGSNTNSWWWGPWQPSSQEHSCSRHPGHPPRKPAAPQQTSRSCQSGYLTRVTASLTRPSLNLGSRSSSSLITQDRWAPECRGSVSKSGWQHAPSPVAGSLWRHS